MKKFWCEVDLKKIEENLNIVKNHTEGKIIGVVKGNAYGLGIEGITDFLKDKVDYFAVSNIEEAERVQGDKEILILTPLIEGEDLKNPKENYIYTIDNEEILKDIDKDFNYKVHIYVDTGMSRMGIKAERLEGFIEHIKTNYSNITIHGLYTHLHNTKNKSYTFKQIEIFKKLALKYMDSIPNIHCLNSSGFLQEDIRKACSFTNVTRIGNILYGYDGQVMGFKKAFTYKAKLINSHKVSKGARIGYGGKYKAKKDMEVGILGFGNIEHFGFNKDVKHNIFYDLLKVVYNHLVKRPVIFSENKGVEIVSKPNMNITMINLQGINKEAVFKVDITPILADSSIPKIYI